MQRRSNFRRASLVDALDSVSMDASGREIAKAQMRRAEAIVNGLEQVVVTSRELVANVRGELSRYARRRKVAARRAAGHLKP